RPVDQCVLHAPATTVLEVDDRLRPVATSPAADVGLDLPGTAPLGDQQVDHAYTGLPAEGWTVSLTDPEPGPQGRLHADAPCPPPTSASTSRAPHRAATSRSTTRTPDSRPRAGPSASPTRRRACRSACARTRRGCRSTAASRSDGAASPSSR